MSNVLITGANSGFGLLTARKFAAAGHIVHAGFRSKDHAGDLDALALEHPNIRPVRLDVTDQGLIDGAIANALEAGPIDLLVNNAGFGVSGPIDSLSDEELRRQFDTNVVGVVRMIRAVAPGMRERKSGAVINLSSFGGWITMPYAAAYNATKHAIESLSEGLWFELAPFGIRVAVIEPGMFATSFHSNMVTAAAFQEGSPHWANAKRFGAGMQNMRAATSTTPGPPASTADPQEVADLIFEAATTNTPKFRYVAGDDARTIIPAYKSMEFESFRGMVLARMGLSDWETARS